MAGAPQAPSTSAASLSALNERLRTVAGKGNCEEIVQLIRLGARFDSDKYGRTALHYAARYGQVKAIRLCVMRGCQMETENARGFTALHEAVTPDGHVEAVRALLEDGCAVDPQDEYGNTPLHEAASNGYSQSLDVLIKTGKADTEASNKSGMTPIHLSCQNGHNQSTRLLLKAGTNPNVKNKFLETPLHTACQFGHITCARILISAECDVNAKNKEGNTPLHVAARLGKQKITRLLLEAQCETKIRNKSNQTAIQLAKLNDFTDVVLLILGVQREKGKRSFFSRNKKKDGDKVDGFGNTSLRFHGDSSPEDKHKHRHGSDRKRGDDDVDGGKDRLRVRGRREMDHSGERHSSGSSKGKKKKKKRDKRREDEVLQGRGQNLFVREELRRQVETERRLQEEIQAGREGGNPNVRVQLFKDKMGKVIHVPMPVQCNCTPYIKKLENQVEASKERLLHEIDISKARFESRMNNVEKRMTHQAQCLDQLCKERIAAERQDCIHRIDKRAKEESAKWSAEHDARSDLLKRELRRWFEARIQPLHEQLSRTCLDDSALDTSTSSSRGRPRAGQYKLNGRESVAGRKRSRSLGNISDCMEEEEEDEEESEDESEDEEDEEEEEEVDGRTSSQPPTEQSPHQYKSRNEQSQEQDYSKAGAIPKTSRSRSFLHAVSDEERLSGSSGHSATRLSMVAGTYRPPLIESHERSPPADPHHSLPPNFVLPSQETDDTASESAESSSATETASQVSFEAVPRQAKSISGASSSTRDSGLHTLKGSSVSSDRRSRGPLRADLIAYQALTVNARPPPPLQAQTHSLSSFHGQQQQPPALLHWQPQDTPPFSPPVSPTSSTSQPLSTSTFTSTSTDVQLRGAATPTPDPISSGNPSPADSGKSQSTSSGVSSGEASSFPNTSAIKYSIVSPHSGESHQRTYNPRGPSSQEVGALKDVNSRVRPLYSKMEPPPYGVVNNGAHRVPGNHQPHVRSTNNAGNQELSAHVDGLGQKAGASLSWDRPPHERAIQQERYIGHPRPEGNYQHVSDTHHTRTFVVSGHSSGAPVVAPKSAASRLGVTPSLGGVRSGVSQSSSKATGAVQPSGVTGGYQNQPKSQPQSYSQSHHHHRPPSSIPSAYYAASRKSGGSAVFAITGTQHPQSRGTSLSDHGKLAAPASANNPTPQMASVPSSSTASFNPTNNHSKTLPAYSNGHHVSNSYSINAGAKENSSGASNSMHYASNRISGESYVSNGGLSSNSNRISGTSSFSNGTSGADARNSARISSASYTSTDTYGNTSSNSKRISGPSSTIGSTTGGANGASLNNNGTGGGSGGGTIISSVENFNKTAAPEQKLKYTREIIL